jgi:hypothetical protein
MTPGRGIVLDANILIRATLGRRVRALLEAYEDLIAFYSPDVCFDDARAYIPRLFNSRGDDPETGMAVSIRSGCSSNRWTKLYIGISSNSRGSEWPRATSKTGRLSQLPSC